MLARNPSEQGMPATSCVFQARLPMLGLGMEGKAWTIVIKSW